MEVEYYTVKQASRQVGASAHTVRYYCKLGLIPGIKYNRTGYRVINQEQLKWLKTLILLRQCGFSIADIKRYQILTEKGDLTIPERKAMLETKRRQLWQIIENAQDNIDFIERKIEVFDKKCKEIDK